MTSSVAVMSGPLLLDRALRRSLISWSRTETGWIFMALMPPGSCTRGRRTEGSKPRRCVGGAGRMTEWRRRM